MKLKISNVMTESEKGQIRNKIKVSATVLIIVNEKTKGSGYFLTFEIASWEQNRRWAQTMFLVFNRITNRRAEDSTS